MGRSRGGFTTKLHASAEGLGNPRRFLLTGGQTHDITQAAALLGDDRPGAVIGDKGYDAEAFIAKIQERGAKVVIPPRWHRKVQREYDAHLYKERHLIECLFSKLKQYRRVFTRYDKLAVTFLGFVHFVAALIWLR